MTYNTEARLFANQAGKSVDVTAGSVSTVVVTSTSSHRTLSTMALARDLHTTDRRPWRYLDRDQAVVPTLTILAT